MKKKLQLLVVSALLWSGTATVQAEVYSGNCGADGANVTWKLDTETGKLEIIGTGAMKNYSNSSIYTRTPWNDYCTSITSVKIGDDITSIGDNAFYLCRNLTSITIPGNVITIGISAFAYSGLTTITIPNNVTTIGNYAFHNCTGLTEVTIENGVQTIQQFAVDYHTRECYLYRWRCF